MHMSYLRDTNNTPTDADLRTLLCELETTGPVVSGLMDKARDALPNRARVLEKCTVLSNAIKDPKARAQSIVSQLGPFVTQMKEIQNSDENTDNENMRALAEKWTSLYYSFLVYRHASWPTYNYTEYAYKIPVEDTKSVNEARKDVISAMHRYIIRFGGKINWWWKTALSYDEYGGREERVFLKPKA